MANQLLLDHPYCKVWQASDELMKLLPAEDAAPKHETGYTQAVDVHQHDGLHWITCMTCLWHTDWDEVFEFVVVNGRSKLYISDSKKDEFNLLENAKPSASCSLKRGCVIQLWPLVKHRIGVFGQAAMIELTGEHKPIFKTQEEQEEAFTTHIRTYYTNSPTFNPELAWK